MPRNDRTFSVRLEVKDGNKVEAFIEGLGDKGERSFRRIDTSLERSNRQLALFGGAMRGLRNVVVGFAAGFGVTQGFRFLTDAVDRASEAEQTIDKARQVFRAASGDVEAFASGLANSLGRSQTELLTFLARLQDTFVPLGATRQKGAELSKQVVQLALDLAAFNNEADADTLESLTSGIVGNTESLRKYGIVITESRLKQELANRGFENGTKGVTELDKALARVDLILKDSADAMGTAAKEADNYQSHVKALSAALDDYSISAGNLFEGGASDVTVFLTDFVRQLEAANKGFDGFLTRRSGAGAAGLSFDGAKLAMNSILQDIVRIRTEMGEIERSGESGRGVGAIRLERLRRQLADLREEFQAFDTAAKRLAPSVADGATGTVEAALGDRVRAALARPAGAGVGIDGDPDGNFAKLIANLEQEIHLRRLNADQRDIEKAVLDAQNKALSEGNSLTVLQIAQLRGLLQTKQDLIDLDQALADEEKTLNELFAEQAKIHERNLEPAERLTEALRNLEDVEKRLNAQGLSLGEDALRERARLIAAAIDDIDAANKRALASSREWADGARRAFDNYSDDALDAAQATENGVNSVLRGLEDVALNLSDLGSLIQGIAEDITRQFIRLNVTGPLSSALSDFLFSGGTGSANILGSPTATLARGGAGDFTPVNAARGMMINRPTDFMAGQRRVRAGELDKEAIFPLTPMPGTGALGIQAMGAGAMEINVQVVNQTGVQSQGRVEELPTSGPGARALRVILTPVVASIIESGDVDPQLGEGGFRRPPVIRG